MESTHFELKANLSHNNGTCNGLFVVQHQAESGAGVIEAIGEGLEELNYLNLDTRLSLIPIITNEFDARLFSSLIIELAGKIGSFATFGASRSIKNELGSMTHLSVIARELGQQSPNYLAPMLRIPRNGNFGFRISRKQLSANLTDVHMRRGTISVDNHDCSLNIV